MGNPIVPMMNPQPQLPIASQAPAPSAPPSGGADISDILALIVISSYLNPLLCSLVHYSSTLRLDQCALGSSRLHSRNLLHILANLLRIAQFSLETLYFRLNLQYFKTFYN